MYFVNAVGKPRSLMPPAQKRLASNVHRQNYYGYAAEISHVLYLDEEAGLGGKTMHFSNLESVFLHHGSITFFYTVHITGNKQRRRLSILIYSYLFYFLLCSAFLIAIQSRSRRSTHHSALPLIHTPRPHPRRPLRSPKLPLNVRVSTLPRHRSRKDLGSRW